MILLYILILLPIATFGIEVDLKGYVEDIQKLKEEFDKIHNVHNNYENQTSQLEEFRNKVSSLMDKYKAQEDLLTGALNKTNAKIVEIFNKLQELQQQTVDVQNKIIENEAAQRLAQEQLEVAKREHKEAEDERNTLNHKLERKRRHYDKCKKWTAWVCKTFNEWLEKADINNFERQIRHYGEKSQQAQNEINRLQGIIDSKNIEIQQLHTTRNNLQAQANQLEMDKKGYQDFQSKAIPWMNVLKLGRMWLQRCQIPLGSIEPSPTASENRYSQQNFDEEYKKTVEAYEEVKKQADEFFKSNDVFILSWDF